MCLHIYKPYNEPRPLVYSILAESNAERSIAAFRYIVTENKQINRNTSQPLSSQFLKAAFPGINLI